MNTPSNRQLIIYEHPLKQTVDNLWTPPQTDNMITVLMLIILIPFYLHGVQKTRAQLILELGKLCIIRNNCKKNTLDNIR